MACMKDGFVEGLLLDDRFETISPLNHGSFGMVFLARDLKTDQDVAIKCISKQSSTSPFPENSYNDHLVELNCHDRLGNHANIVNLLHAFETDAHMFLVLEFCPNGDLYEAIREGKGPLETEHVRGFMLQLLDAVEFMHSKGLYHRDMKPENIFLSQDGSMKLGDFGLSTTEAWTYEASVGSDRYMAPEQFDPAENGYAPAQADIWAIGICLLNVLFSRNPFVTPSESDILFTDFVRDRQSLFDIFPSMSQDTFEILNHALTIDPTKRSIPALRAGLERALIFTTEDDLLDDFCTEDREIVPASANRQPLRTPSIQSPPIEQGGAFPWAKALEMSPHQNGRQLSVIADLDDDLFPEKTTSWYTPTAQTPSIYSVIDSTLGASIKSLTLREPKPRHSAKVDVTTVSGSLPVSGSKPIRAMSTVFGKKENMVSKSWSDLWDEEEEELEDARRQFNERNLSTDSIDEDITIRRSGLSEMNPSVANSRAMNSVHDELGVFGANSSTEDVNSFEKVDQSAYKYPLYSPPAKRSMFDKWSALGNRRRAVGSDTEDNKPPVDRKRSNTQSRRRGFGFKSFTGNVGLGGSSENASATEGMGIKALTIWDRKERDKLSKNKETEHGDGVKILDWRRENAMPSPYNRRFSNYYGEKSIEDDMFNDGDVEWVGGWNDDLHL